MTIDETTRPDEAAARELALKRLKKRADFRGHLLVYTLVNAVLIAIWAVTSPHAFFWPIFPILGWGVAVILNAWDVYRSDSFSEEKIQREIERSRRSR